MVSACAIRRLFLQVAASPVHACCRQTSPPGIREPGRSQSACRAGHERPQAPASGAVRGRDSRGTCREAGRDSRRACSRSRPSRTGSCRHRRAPASRSTPRQPAWDRPASCIRPGRAAQQAAERASFS